MGHKDGRMRIQNGMAWPTWGKPRRAVELQKNSACSLQLLTLPMSVFSPPYSGIASPVLCPHSVAQYRLLPVCT